MGSLDGKVALVTGAAATVGFLAARALALAGAQVLLTDRNIKKANDLALECRSEGLDVVAHRLDVTREDEWIAAILRAKTDYGRLNVLVHAATIAALRDLEELSLDEWRRVHAVNLDAAFIGTKYALPLMNQSGGASVIMNSPIVGAPGHHKFASYFCSKAAVMMLTQSVAMHCAAKGYAVRCNAVQPLFIDSERVMGIVNSGRDPDTILNSLINLMPIGGENRSDDFISAIVFLASDESRMMNGKELTLNPIRLPSRVDP